VSSYLAVHRDEVDRVFTTLSYFDVATLAHSATAPSLFVAALMDMTTPPSTVFAAYNNYGGDKRMIVYPFNGHEGGGSHYSREKIEFVSRLCD
jgi:cephalosporin-C deacetylase